MRTWQALCSTAFCLTFLPFSPIGVQAATIIDASRITFLNAVDSLTDDQNAEGTEGTVIGGTLSLNNSFLGDFSRKMSLEITSPPSFSSASADIGSAEFVKPGVQRNSGLFLENGVGVSSKVTLEYSMAQAIDFTQGKATGLAVELISADLGSDIELVFSGASANFSFLESVHSSTSKVVVFPFNDFGDDPSVDFKSIRNFSLSLAGQNPGADIKIRILATYAPYDSTTPNDIKEVPEPSPVLGLLGIATLAKLLSTGKRSKSSKN